MRTKSEIRVAVNEPRMFGYSPDYDDGYRNALMWVLESEEVIESESFAELDELASQIFIHGLSFNSLMNDWETFSAKDAYKLAEEFLAEKERRANEKRSTNKE